MTVRKLIECAGFTPLCLPDPEREISGCYTGDLLSWVMGRAETGCAWVTIMTNSNIVAVASLIDMACIIISDNCEVDDSILSLALEKGINILRSDKPSYETCTELFKAL